jgi:hypothetical protein
MRKASRPLKKYHPPPASLLFDYGLIFFLLISLLVVKDVEEEKN